MTAATSKTFSLPSVGAGDVGLTFTFINLGTSIVVIDAADSDTIITSGAGDTIYNPAGEPWANITLKLATATLWVATGGHGTWITTD
jgi:hypothetical protein